MLLMLLFVGCEKEKENVRTKSFNFEATIEQLQSSDSTKVYFNNEQWIYWELGDQISIGSNMTTGNVTPAVGGLAGNRLRGLQRRLHCRPARELEIFRRPAPQTRCQQDYRLGRGNR